MAELTIGEYHRANVAARRQRAALGIVDEPRTPEAVGFECFWAYLPPPKPKPKPKPKPEPKPKRKRPTVTQELPAVESTNGHHRNGYEPLGAHAACAGGCAAGSDARGTCPRAAGGRCQAGDGDVVHEDAQASAGQRSAAQTALICARSKVRPPPILARRLVTTGRKVAIRVAIPHTGIVRSDRHK